LRKAIGFAAWLMVVPSPAFGVLLFFLWMFWEKLGKMTLDAYDDYHLRKTEEALKGGLHASLDGYYVHMLTMRSKAERERRSRARLARKRRIKAVYRAIARAFISVRNLSQRGKTADMRAVT
jgi:hypothetical protein